jgi:hypothetical protein
MSSLAHLTGRSIEYAREELCHIAFGNFVSLFLGEPINFLKDRHEVLEVSAGLWVDGIDGAEHLSGKKHVIGAHPLD